MQKAEITGGIVDGISESGGTGDNPLTGDNGNIFLWMILLAGTGMVLAGCAIYSRKKKE